MSNKDKIIGLVGFVFILLLTCSRGWEMSPVVDLLYFIVVLPLSMVIILATMLISGKISLINWLVLFNTIFVVGIFTGLIVSSIIISLNKTKCNKIIHSLESYYKVHESFPKELSDLQPKFIGSLPILRKGVFHKTPISYHSNSKQEFSLSFRVVNIDVGSNYIYQSNSPYDFWRFDD